MIPEKQDTKLATSYEKLRRREYELITDLLDVLPKIDGIAEERVTQMRDALFHADHPYLIVLVGPFSSGKSSIINALLGKSDLLPVGPTPTTDRITMLRWGEDAARTRSGEVDTVFYPSPLLEKVSFVDTPGLESIFQQHEVTTRAFLHRSDTVFLIMLATQAMTARNLESLKMLQEYGKTVIVIINQVDMLTPEERESVRQYVLDQSHTLLGYKPQIWMMSSRQAMDARGPSGEIIDEAAWEASGVGQIERYVDDQLSDVARLRQKLQTPLQIAQSVHQTALTAVRSNQAALDKYQSIAQNIDRQLATQKREQERIVREISDEVSAKFGEAAMRGSEAIRDQFRFTRAFVSLYRGLLELVGLAGLARRGANASYTRAAFDQRKALEPVKELPAVIDKLGPRLEGKDIQDIDALVKYARREIDALPAAIREKVIGSVQPPLQYDRTAIQQMRPDLEAIEDEARMIETDRLESALRNTVLYLAGWVVLLLIFAAFLVAWNPPTPDQPVVPLVLLLMLGLALLGLAFVPLRGRLLEGAYTNRMLKLQARYLETMTKAADKQVAYGMGQRRDAIAPLTRLVEAQTGIQTEQLNKLQAAQTEMVKIESELTALGKSGLFGIRG